MESRDVIVVGSGPAALRAAIACADSGNIPLLIDEFGVSSASGSTPIAGIAAFATFQFLWVYNDFLVANVFLGINPRNQVITSHVAQLTVGNYGEAWHLRTAGAVISMIVPLIVFFSLQRFFIRGLIGGAVKG